MILSPNSGHNVWPSNSRWSLCHSYITAQALARPSDLRLTLGSNTYSGLDERKAAKDTCLSFFNSIVGAVEGELLPGPRDREGLPESISFWTFRLKETDADKTFSVGLIYGPTGCGKSSLVKAGLLPRLSHEVVAVYVEATPDDTETRILSNYLWQ